MEFKQYPSYKKSGVEWLGDVPEHWESNRLKKYLIERNEKNSPIKTDNLLSVTMYQGVIPVSEKQGNGGNKPKENLENYKISYPNDIVLNSMNVIVGSVGLNKYTGLISPAYYALYNRNKNNNIKFFSYIFHNPFFQKGLFGLGNGIMYKESEDGKLNTIRLKIPMEKLNQVVLPCPSISEQNQIVSFLDTETARIDNLIAKQEKLIELLEEQRKSIISHAVTKGLNPNAPMKDSGVEWLGDVPEHWMTPSSKHLLEIPITDGPHETPNFVDDGVPFISAEAISKGKIDFDKKRGYITPELNAIYSKKYSPKIEDIYMVKSGATTGKVAMVETTEEFNIWSPLAVFRCNKNKVLPKFLLAVFNSSHFYDALVLNWSYGTQQNIGMGVLSNIEIPCPPLKEQAEIIQHLDAQNTKFDKLISTQSQLIEKLKEYRSSIISHAVTGKIDVREFGA